MTYHYKRLYRETIQCAIFDFAGTTIDHGCVAPVAGFMQGFANKGIEITMAQARAPMGMGKWEHIQTIAQMEPVAAQWEAKYGRPSEESDIDEMYADFAPILVEILPKHSTLIPGVPESMNLLREMGLKIAATTGYFDEALAICLEAAKSQGYEPDFATCSTQVKGGRPAPWMIYQVLAELDLYPPEAVVKIGDTVVDIEAGLNAGVWTIGVAQTGNEVGLSVAEWEALAEDEQDKRVGRAQQKLLQAGAHFVVDTVEEVPDIVAEINDMLWMGMKP